MRPILLLLIFFLCTVVVLVSALQAQHTLVINEFMADNNSFLSDTTDNHFDDWIEIYNSGSSHFILTDYFLTDDPSRPKQWAFPEATIAPGEFLLIWADNDSGDLGFHTNFKLNKEGEFLGLYSYQNFLTNIEIDVVVEMNMPVPGIKSFSKRRNENLKTQLSHYLQTPVSSENSAVHSFELRQNYPNPFNPNTTIDFSLSYETEVKLEIFDILGKKIAALFTGILSAGQHKLNWQATGLPGGIYYAPLKTESERKIIKMMLLK